MLPPPSPRSPRGTQFPSGGGTANGVYGTAGGNFSQSTPNISSVIAPFLHSSVAPTPAAAPRGGSANVTHPLAPRAPSSYHYDVSVAGAGEIWDTIEARVLPLFVGEGLNSTLEELNALLARYLAQQLYGTIIEELKGLVREGVARMMDKFLVHPSAAPTDSSDLSGAAAATAADGGDGTTGSGVSGGSTSLLISHPASQSLFLARWTEVWVFYFSVVLPYMQSVFLPLQNEIKGSKLVNSVRTLVLLGFRDRAVIANLAELQELVDALALEAGVPAKTPPHPPLAEILAHAGDTHGTGSHPGTPMLSHASLPSTPPATPSAPNPPPQQARQQQPGTTSSSLSDPRVALFLQMLLVLGDLPLAPSATGNAGGIGSTTAAAATLVAGGAEHEARVRQIRAMREVIKRVMHSARNGGNGGGSNGTTGSTGTGARYHHATGGGGMAAA
ncbi:hypothetical protein BC828DRAFT_388861 [Blastocladiella britannica]|nr:hypothetical protein BC828DRAFT_388861 [Blastocladiella britannica]